MYKHGEQAANSFMQRYMPNDFGAGGPPKGNVYNLEQIDKMNAPADQQEWTVGRQPQQQTQQYAIGTQPQQRPVDHQMVEINLNEDEEPVDHLAQYRR